MSTIGAGSMLGGWCFLSTKQKYMRFCISSIMVNYGYGTTSSITSIIFSAVFKAFNIRY